MATKTAQRFSVGDTIYLINGLFSIYEAVVVEVTRSGTSDLVSKVNYQNGTDDMFVFDAKAVLATAENYEHLATIFGDNAFIFPNDPPNPSISSHYQDIHNKPKTHRVSRWADGSVSEVTQSTKHAQKLP